MRLLEIFWDINTKRPQLPHLTQSPPHHLHHHSLLPSNPASPGPPPWNYLQLSGFWPSTRPPPHLWPPNPSSRRHISSARSLRRCRRRRGWWRRLWGCPRWRWSMYSKRNCSRLPVLLDDSEMITSNSVICHQIAVAPNRSFCLIINLNLLIPFLKNNFEIDNLVKRS